MLRRNRFEIKTAEQIETMRAAGLVVAHALAAVSNGAHEGVTTLELDAIAEAVIRDAGATPSFLGYHGFPASICVSVNDEVIHGIPGSRVLADGDLVSIDCGAIVLGWHGDAAVTVGVGELAEPVAELSRVTEAALQAGLAAARPGARLGDIGAEVEQEVRRSGRQYGIVTEYVGHGIGSRMHMAPNVPNVGTRGKGPELVVGMALAIEPMITLGSPEVAVLGDGWTVVSDDGSLAAHWEHTVAITPDGPWVLTALPVPPGVPSDAGMA
ncbi:MAG: type I methionyl aminopeptidase [Actinomycetes bacterium]